jgi:nicotinamide-nucleotide amidase
MDQLETLATALGHALHRQSIMLALVESCTGGMIAQAVTSVPGSSAWFDRGFITYSNPSKVEMLGVNAQTLAQYGAVSEQVASQMAQGALTSSHAHISGSVTGIAGPDGGTADKPVGMVCFAIAKSTGETISSTQYFSGSRSEIRSQATQWLLHALLDTINHGVAL